MRQQGCSCRGEQDCQMFEPVRGRALSVLQAGSASALCSRPQFHGRFRQSNTSLLGTISDTSTRLLPPPQIKQHIRGGKYPPSQLGCKEP